MDSSAVNPSLQPPSHSSSAGVSHTSRRMRSSSPLTVEEGARRWSHASDATLVTSPSAHNVSRLSTRPPRQPSQHPYSSTPLHQIPDKPLIDLVTNEWRSKEKYLDYYDKDYEEDEYGQFIMPDKAASGRLRCPIRFNRRSLRYLILYLCFMAACLYTWMNWLKPAMDEDDILDASMYRATFPGRQMGTNAKPDFSDMRQLKYLEKQYIPGATNSGNKRLVIVGDVHGCKDELEALLKKVAFNDENDHLILTGDLIFKGPDSGGVVDLARSKDASCVRGNHEDRTLLAYASLGSNRVAVQDPIEQIKKNVQKTDINDAFGHGDRKHLELAKQLTSEQLKWLQQCPVILNIGVIHKTDYVVVHGGLAPGVRLEKQDPFQVMNMRTIDLGTRVPSETRSGEPWEKVWNHFQSHTHPSSLRKTAIYGHDSRRGLNIQKYSKGLDSGCVAGGKLTALVINSRGKETRYSVKCQNYLEEKKKLKK